MLSPRNKNTIKMPRKIKLISSANQFPIFRIINELSCASIKNFCASPVRYLLIFLIFQSLANSNLYTHTASVYSLRRLKERNVFKILIFLRSFFHSCASRHRISSGINFLSCSNSNQSGA